MTALIEQMLSAARKAAPNEACGLIVTCGKKSRLFEAKNIHPTPRTDFHIDPDVWLNVEDGEEVIGIFHSHPVTSAQPSMNDLVSCENTGLPWHIVNPETEEYAYFEPSGYRAPYTRRPYVHGVLDCYAVVRDWYSRELGIVLKDYDRKDRWWERGQNLYVDNFVEAGFSSLIDKEPEFGDSFLIQINSSVPNHAAVYIGGGQILHHVQGRLSRVDVYGGQWQDSTTHHLRHISRI